MLKRTRKLFSSKNIISLAVIAFFLLHTSEISSIPFLDKIESQAYDLHLNLTMPNSVDERIVIVDIDEKSLATLGRWPWDRQVIAKLANELLNHYEVSIIGFDVFFVEEDEGADAKILKRLASDELKKNNQYQQVIRKILPTLDHDKKLADSINGQPVVLGYFFDTNSLNATQKGQLPDPFYVSALQQERFQWAEQASGYAANLSVLQQAAQGGGFVDNPMLDADGVVRRVRMLMKYGNNYYASLSLAMVAALMGFPEPELEIGHGYGGGDRFDSQIESLTIAGSTIPFGAMATATVPYRGPMGSYNYISVIDVLNHVAKKETLEEAIILIGSSAPGLLDLRSTPVGTAYAGVEVHANMISGILDNTIPKHPPYVRGVENVLLLFMGLIIIILVPRLSAAWVLAALGISVSLLVLLRIVMWTNSIVLNVEAIILMILTVVMVHVSYGFLFEQRQKKQLAHSFGQYVPPELVDEMSLSEDQEFSLEGESRELTVFFSDVRSFSTISESLTPKQLKQWMNEYLTPMTGVIHRNRGTIDKYIGDAIMAFWGAPLKDESHASHAIDAAMEMLDLLKPLNQIYQERDWPPIRIGVGLNTGIMNVGNMGSEFRMAYTVMGDAVNLGSRLEGLTKKYGVELIVSEYTKNAAPDYVYRQLDKVTVVGKAEAVSIFQPVARVHELSQENETELSVFHEALSLYFKQDWQQAKLAFQKLLHDYSKLPIYEIYLKRVLEFMQSPPSDDWDGVYQHTSK